jgi:hypothetical protein
MSKVIEVSKFTEIAKGMKIDLSRVIAYAEYFWVIYQKDKNNFYYQEKVDEQNIGKTIAIFIAGYDGTIRRRDVVATLDDSGFPLLQDTINLLDKIFIEPEETHFFLPLLKKRTKRIKKSFIKIGNVRINYKTIIAYHELQLPIGYPPYTEFCLEVLPQEDLVDSNESVAIIENEKLLNEEITDEQSLNQVNIISFELGYNDEFGRTLFIPAIFFDEQEFTKAAKTLEECLCGS